MTLDGILKAKAISITASIPDVITDIPGMNDISIYPEIVNRPAKNVKKSRTKVTIEDLVVDDELKKDIIEFYARTDLQHPSYWMEKRRIKKEYRQQCAEYMTTTYHWPPWIATETTKCLSIPKDRVSIGDLAIGYLVASWSKRFLKPFADLRGKKITLYTNINILADVVWLGISALAIFGTDGHYDSELMQNVMHGIHHACNEGKIISDLVYANFIVRGFQIPVRAYYSIVKEQHTWSPATLVHPNVPESIIFGIIQGYDWVLKGKEYFKEYKERKRDNYLNHS
jgi:hypothetical protein